MILRKLKKLQELSERKADEYLKVLKDGKKLQKILAENNYNPKKEIQDKRDAFEKMIDKEVEKLKSKSTI